MHSKQLSLDRHRRIGERATRSKREKTQLMSSLGAVSQAFKVNACKRNKQRLEKARIELNSLQMQEAECRYKWSAQKYYTLANKLNTLLATQLRCQAKHPPHIKIKTGSGSLTSNLCKVFEEFRQGLAKLCDLQKGLDAGATKTYPENTILPQLVADVISIGRDRKQLHTWQVESPPVGGLQHGNIKLFPVIPSSMRKRSELSHYYESSELPEQLGAAMASACCMNTKDDLTSPSADTPSSGTPSSLLMEEIQGYDVEFDPPLESKYECPICLMALREPLQTPCGHRFCKACILKSIRDAGSKCPVDNDLLLEHQLFPDNFAKREILSLTVKCPSPACLAKMELRHLESHQSRCQYASVECAQCQQVFLRSDLQQHMAVECPRRKVTCENCSTSMPYDERMEHEQKCPLAYVTCEYCQTSDLIREQIATHYDVDCTMAPIPCTFSRFGCTEKMQRHNLARHLQEFLHDHMQMMALNLRSISCTTTPSFLMPNMPLDPGQFEPGPPSVYPGSPSLGGSPNDNSHETQQLKEIIKQLETRLVKQDHQIRELTAKMETQTAYVTELKHTIRVLEDKFGDAEARNCNGVFVWKIQHFSAHLKSQEEDDRPVVIHSPGFYTGKPGYQLCLRLHLQLPNAPRCANYISLFVHTMQGEYDNLLVWPFQGTIRLSILDQSEGSNGQDQEETMDTKPDLLAFQRPTMPRNPKGFGYVTFMHLQALKQRMYIKNDTLLVRCVVTTHNDISSPRREGFQPRNTDGATL
ncbi:TNF receptor-associated factor 6 [Gastrophryne carolinensis]